MVEWYLNTYLGPTRLYVQSDKRYDPQKSLPLSLKLGTHHCPVAYREEELLGKSC